MSKYNKRLRIRPVINSLVAEPRYYYECKDWYGGIGTGLTIPQAVGDYLKETKPQVKSAAVEKLINEILKLRRDYTYQHLRAPDRLFINTTALDLIMNETQLYNHGKIFGMEVIRTDVNNTGVA